MGDTYVQVDCTAFLSPRFASTPEEHPAFPDKAAVPVLFRDARMAVE